MSFTQPEPPTAWGRPVPEPMGNPYGPLQSPPPPVVMSTYTSPLAVPLIVASSVLGFLAVGLILVNTVLLGHSRTPSPAAHMTNISMGLLLLSCGLNILTQLHNRRQRVVADDRGIRREGGPQSAWETAWPEIAEVWIRERTVVRLCVVEKPAARRLRNNWLITWTFGTPWKSVFSCLEPGAVAPLAAMCQARGIPVVRQ